MIIRAKIYKIKCKLMDDLNILTIEEIEKKLKDFPGWIFSGNKISKTFVFPSFKDAVKMIDRLKLFCDQIDHHPDIHILYKKIIFELSRFSVGGKVTERDFTVAKEIETLYSSFKMAQKPNDN